MKKAVLTTTILSLLLPLTSGEAQNINSRVIGLSSGDIVLLDNNVKGLNVEGQLDNDNNVSYVDIHTFEGKAGETIVINLISDDFDAFLILEDPDSEIIASNNDGGKGENARIVIELQKTGTYTVLVTKVKADERGNYQLSTRQATETDIALDKAEKLNEQVVQLYKERKYNEAIPLAEQALAIRKEQLGDNHPSTATSLNNLAELYDSQGRYTEAEPLYVQALAIRKEQLGDNHADTANSLNNLAVFYHVQGRYTEAEPL